ncbi:hypothetical protein [Peribacillus kribbensis]|uniref:hypothetical protein n=1 Tax=Peribacillus kribbensis TaxID=356658 RepID=UPI0004016531|nr:hypothetical protein [Peribacillus kribbensis]
MDTNAFLASWKEQLESENTKITNDLEAIQNQITELRLKKEVIDEVIFYTNSSEDTIESFKLRTGYNGMVSRLNALENRDQTEEKASKQQKHYNNLIIQQIDKKL